MTEGICLTHDGRELPCEACQYEAHAKVAAFLADQTAQLVADASALIETSKAIPFGPRAREALEDLYLSAQKAAFLTKTATALYRNRAKGG